MSFFKSNRQLPDPEKPALPAEEDAVLEKLAQKVVAWKMTVPAILALESVKPLNFIGSQAMVFFEPIIQSVFSIKDYDTLRCALEKRETIEILLLKIEAHDVVAQAREKRIKKFMKAERKNWRWYQRYLGVFVPKTIVPDDVLDPPEKNSDTATS
ncbi:MAG: hypothetical protein OEV49_11065 [candidate division Zixibacteria bacterium]|nr:hypothetical protein [candidate division Zixibacteria bacterium]MDH3936733.1 hypothetical protein [candidate division Zixibacteria bacterium]MDH4032682.1 hypothetical protein [candidate division Zixibacteria bacterium]